MTTEPKVKPLVAFAAARDGKICAGTVCQNAGQVRDAVGAGYACGWAAAKRQGYRIVKVRIEPVE